MENRTNELNPVGVNELPSMDRWELERRARFAAQPVYLGDGVALCRVLTRYKCFVDTTDLGFGANLLLDGFWESWITTFIAARVQPGDWVIDVGANHGYYTLLMADLVGPTGRVAAVEPNPAICRLMRQSVAVNGFASRVTLLEQAATAVDGATVVLGLPANEPKNAHVLESLHHAAQRGEEAITVPGGRIATALAAWDRLDFIKIDVEGAEESVVHGLSPLLERHKPRVILEFNAGRCHAPGALLDKLIELYGTLQQVAFDGNAHPVDRETLLSGDTIEDWLLFLERPT
jgi:FkbM family methyltransferase